jgi:hypothetical protein
MRRAVLLLLLAGCSYRPPNSYAVDIDPSFTVAEQQSIVSAADAWSAAIPQLELRTGLSACHTESDNTICISPSHALVAAGPYGDALGGTAYEISAGGKARTTLYVDLVAAQTRVTLETVAAHELGHAMWLHHSGPGSLMCSDTGCMAHGPTAADVEQWKAVRR